MIGIFDSGSGGLTVLKALRKRAPQCDVVYFGDLKNAPYGNKSREELGALTVLGIQKLVEAGASEIVSACNSVSVSIALPMFDILDIPRASIIEMVGPTVSAFKGTEAKVLVVATRATIDSGAYQNGFRMIGVEAEGVALPHLVDLIEGGGSPDTMISMACDTLAPYRAQGFSHVVLGCTHFPLVRSIFEQSVAALMPEVVLVDPADAVADAVMARFDTQGTGHTEWILSADSAVFWRFAG